MLDKLVCKINSKELWKIFIGFYVFCQAKKIELMKN